MAYFAETPLGHRVMISLSHYRCALVRSLVCVCCLLLPEHVLGKGAGRETPSEPGDGAFVDLLTNGLADWTVEMDPKEPGEATNWSIQDGVLVCRGHGYGFLRYNQKLCDFDLRTEYRLSANGNSGIGLRGVPYRGSKLTRPSFAGYEVQILDDQAKKPSTQSTGSLYRYVAPTVSASRKSGEWNSLEISCRGPHIRVILNGKVVQDIDQTKIESLRKKPLCGHVTLQCHRAPVEFRDVRLRIISSKDSSHRNRHDESNGKTRTVE